jgi:hypothetical protein
VKRGRMSGTEAAISTRQPSVLKRMSVMGSWLFEYFVEGMYRIGIDAMDVHDPDKHLDRIISVISSL